MPLSDKKAGKLIFPVSSMNDSVDFSNVVIH